MKSRILFLTIFLTLVVGMPRAMADATAEPTAWEKVTSMIKVTVHNWISYWNGDATTPTTPTVQQPAQPTRAPATPVESATPVSTGTTATVPTATATVPLKPQAAPVAVEKPKATPGEASTRLRNQPLFTNESNGSSLQDVQTTRDTVKSKNLLKVAQPARPGTSKLAKTKSGVPTVNWAHMRQVKKIPLLDIGTEILISREDFTWQTLSWGVRQPSEFKKLPQPAPIADNSVSKLVTPVTKVLGPRGLQANIRTTGKPVTQETVDKVAFNISEVAKFKELPYKPLSDEQIKMVAALVLFSQGNHCHMIMGLFNQLASAEKTKIEATYHLGACAAELKMHQSAFDNLSKVVASENKEFAPDALGILAKDLLVIYEKDFYKLVKGLKNPKALITEKTRDDVSYRLAKGAYRAGDFKTSIAYAEQVSSSAEFYDDARFLTGMNSFALGDKAGALKRLKDLWASLEARKITKGNIRALTSLNLARMYFSQKKFDKALEHYMQIPKDHPLWVQALIEQGWTQLAIEDYSGAVGNMYSLHSPYFKAVYQPESFVVRTIGYLNICQFGDAYKSMTWLEKDYRDWRDKLSGYISKKGNPEDIYSTVKNYIRGKSSDDVEGVPYQVWREMAHRKDFLNLQTSLNDKMDEGGRYEGVNEKIKQEKASIRYHAEQSKKRFDQLRALIAKASAEKGQSGRLEELRASLKLEKDLIVGYRFQLAILEQSREGYLAFQKASQSKLNTETATLTSKTGSVLLTHAKHMEKEMSRDLDNNEFLRYEIFAGSGENIRYQVAGGQVSGPNRIPAHIKPAKMMNWSFDGEFWEDEIGSYRSALQNNCPTNQQAQKAERVPTSQQARHVNDDDDN